MSKCQGGASGWPCTSLPAPLAWIVLHLAPRMRKCGD